MLRRRLNQPLQASLQQQPNEHICLGVAIKRTAICIKILAALSIFIDAKTSLRQIPKPHRLVGFWALRGSIVLIKRSSELERCASRGHVVCVTNVACAVHSLVCRGGFRWPVSIGKERSTQTALAAVGPGARRRRWAAGRPCWGRPRGVRRWPDRRSRRLR